MEISISKILLISLSFLFAVAIFIAFILMYFWVNRQKQRYTPFTEDSLRLPGHSVRLDQSRLSDGLLLLYLQFIVAIVAISYFLYFLKGPLRFILSATLILYVFYLSREIWKNMLNIQKYVLGREGEEYTGQELNLLMRSGAFVFHDIPYKYGNIDHIVIGRNKIFTVETKGIRKPSSANNGSRESTVVFNGKTLKFPHKTIDYPVTQALRHAKYMSEIIEKKCGVNFPVVAVVALPGWFIQNDAKFQDILVINPKRGKALKNWLGELNDKESRDKVVAHVASVARSVDYGSGKTDPNASKKYDFWLNPRVKETKLGD